MRIKKQRKKQHEEAIMLLMFISQNPRDTEENIGTLIPLTKIERIMKLKGKRLYRRLKDLEELGLIEFRNNHYEPGKKSRKVFITKKADEIIYNDEMILKYFTFINNAKENFIDDEVDTDNFPYLAATYPNEKIKNKSMISDNIGYKYNTALSYLHNIIVSNNNYTKLKYTNTCRIISSKSTTVEFKGRVYNPLCFTKNGNKEYSTQDKRILRSDFLRIFDYADYFEVFDIKSEIPRLTYILQGGNYDDIDDFYNLPRHSRKYVKKHFMNCYFGKSLNSERWHTLRRFLQDNKLPLSISDEHKESWYNMFSSLWNHYHTIIKPIGAEIFLWTSLWEQLIIKEAREQLGVNLLNVYDAFYFNDSSIKDDLNRIAQETSIIVRNIYNDTKQ
jgi:DNA-binding MarR family transcriptional regulator